MRVKDKVFILKTLKYSDSDLILHCLSAKDGLISLIAKGALRSKKRFAGGVLEPTHYVHVSYQKKENSNEERLHLLQEASMLKDFSALRVHYDRLDTALYFLQLINKVSHAGDPHAEEIFNLLGNALKALLTCEDYKQIKIHFEIKLLYHEGVLPEELTEAAYLSHSIDEHALVDLSVKDRSRISHGLHNLLKNYIG